MSAGGKGVKVLEEIAASLRDEIKERQTKLAAIEDAIRKVKGEPEPKQFAARGRRGLNVKAYLVELLERRGYFGLTATTAVELAEQEGKSLERGTVSSLLSRMKHDGIVTYDNVVYRLPKYQSITSTPVGAPLTHAERHPDKIVSITNTKAAF